MNTLIRYVKTKLQARKNRRNAVRMLVYSGALRRASHSVRYALTERQIRSLLAEE